MKRPITWDGDICPKETKGVEMTNLDKLPELCYTFVGGNSPGERIGIIKRGESGYYAVDFDSPTATESIVRDVVRQLNSKMGVTPAQELAMSIGSMCGWDVPGADPDNVHITSSD